MARRKDLTVTKIRELKPDPDKRQWVPDGQVPGLGVRISERGTKTYVLRARIKGETVWGTHSQEIPGGESGS